MASPRPLKISHSSLPAYVEDWFTARGWQAHPYQRAMVDAFRARQPALLIAPTGGGKTLSGFLPSLIDVHERRPQGIHTLYVSPLKALTNDIERNLMQPIAQMGLAVTVESRTGDTPPECIPHHAGKPDADALATRCRAAFLRVADGDRGRGA
jgi:ATP-dependent Lhr-like helicase